MIDNTDFSTDFMKYRGPTATTTMNSSTYPSYSDLEQPSSWLRGTDFTSLAGDLFSSTTAAPPKENEISYGNLSNLNLNLDQIKIGDNTMENVLKALDPNNGRQSDAFNYTNNNSGGYGFTSYNNFNNSAASGPAPPTGSSFLNGLNLDTSFTAAKPRTSYNFDYLKPTNRSNIIKSHNSTNTNNNNSNKVSFQHPPASQFFSSPDESFVNMTLPAMDTSLIFSDKSNKKTTATATASGYNFGNTNLQYKSHHNNNPSVPGYSSSSAREKEQFVSFAVQQYRMLAGLNPEMIRDPENIEELADRETFKYWSKLFIEERERQARIVLNLQKALTEALSGSAAKGPNVLTHLGAATGDFELETIGKYADQCRKRSQMISNYFNSKKL